MILFKLKFIIGSNSVNYLKKIVVGGFKSTIKKVLTSLIVRP